MFSFQINMILNKLNKKTHYKLEFCSNLYLHIFDIFNELSVLFFVGLTFRAYK